jgi:hypothetical protein
MDAGVIEKTGRPEAAPIQSAFVSKKSFLGFNWCLLGPILHR